MIFRTLLNKLHRWAGLVLAIFLLALGLSGALLILEGNLLPSSFVGERYYPVQTGEQRVPIQQVLDELHQQYGEWPQQVSLRGEPGRPDEYRFAGRRTFFVDPFTGNILGESADFRTSFSRTLWDFHATLLLGEPGRWIVGLTTAVLALSLLAGLVLAGYSIQRLGWRRTLSLRQAPNGHVWNRRFHNLMGFIWSPVLLLISLTGCFIAFSPLEKATLYAFGAPQVSSAAPLRSINEDSANSEPISPDQALQLSGVLEQYPSYQTLRLQLPRTAEDTYRIQISAAGYASERSEVFIDPISGERLAEHYAHQKAETDTLRWFIRSFHYGTFLGGSFLDGSFLGAVSEVIWLAGCLMLAVFVISGLLLWRWKTRRQPILKPKQAMTNTTSSTTQDVPNKTIKPTL